MLSLPRIEPATLVIDPGKKAGWAIFRGRELITSGFVRGDNPEEAAALLLRVRLHYQPCESIVIEDQLPMGPRNWKATRTLIRRGALWWALWRAAGNPESSIRWVAPPTWQAAILKVGRADSKTRAKMCVEYVKRYFPDKTDLVDVTPDQAAAIAIGLFYATYVATDTPDLGISKTRAKNRTKSA